jgi:hypothetical protein
MQSGRLRPVRRVNTPALPGHRRAPLPANAIHRRLVCPRDAIRGEIHDQEDSVGLRARRRDRCVQQPSRVVDAGRVDNQPRPVEPVDADAREPERGPERVARGFLTTTVANLTGPGQQPGAGWRIRAGACPLIAQAIDRPGRADAAPGRRFLALPRRIRSASDRLPRSRRPPRSLPPQRIDEDPRRLSRRPVSGAAARRSTPSTSPGITPT